MRMVLSNVVRCLRLLSRDASNQLGYRRKKEPFASPSIAFNPSPFLKIIHRLLSSNHGIVAISSPLVDGRAHAIHIIHDHPTPRQYLGWRTNARPFMPPESGPEVLEPRTRSDDLIDYLSVMILHGSARECESMESQRTSRIPVCCGLLFWIQFNLPLKILLQRTHAHENYCGVDDVNNCRHDPIGLEETWGTKWWAMQQFTFLCSVAEVNAVNSRA
jgi:hypothetical protein